MLLVTFADLGFLLFEFITGDVQFSVVTLCTSLSFFIELLVVIGYDGFEKHFRFNRKWLVAELVIVTASFVVEYSEYILETQVPESSLSGRLRYFRAVRFFRVPIIFRTRYDKLVSSLRRLVSADRRRYVADGFDLDLTYVHDHVIAMSWPSSKAESLYRNKIDTVAAFLDMKHPDSYHVYNLCSERSYDESKFHNYCTRFYLDDHNPPELATMLTFGKTVDTFLAKDRVKNVAVIHCKGGKGRTGTMVCAYLMYGHIKRSAADALAHFGKIRTAETAKSFQGVESPSQERYVHYFDSLLKSPSLTPPARRVRLATMRLVNLPVGWWARGVDRLWLVVILRPSTDRQVVFISNPTVTFNPFPVVKGPQYLSPSGSPARSPGLPPNASPSAAGKPEPSEPSALTTSPTTAPKRKAKMGSSSPSNHHQHNSDDDEFASSAVDGCQPFGGNFIITVGDKPNVPLDCQTFDAEYVQGPASHLSAEGAGSAGGLGVASSAANFIAASSARFGSGIPRHVNRDLVVNVDVNTSSIPPLDHDVQVKLFHNVDNPDALHSKCQFWFHCSYEGERLLLHRCQIDGPHKEGEKPKKFPANFAIDLSFDTL
jgi:protein-tyrosine phosphatase